MRSAVISNYKKNTEGRYHRLRKEDMRSAQCEMRMVFNGASWAKYSLKPRIPEGAVHLIIGESLANRG